MPCELNQTATYPTLYISEIKFDLGPVWNGVNAETFAALAFHGLKQKAGDAFSTFKGTKDEKQAQAQKVLDNLANNDLRATRESDPIANEIRKIAMALANKKRPNDMKVIEWAKSDTLKKLFDEYRADAKVIAMAERNVADLEALEV